MLYLPFYQDQYQTFLCNAADKPANQQTNVNREETENREHNLLGVKIQLALAH